MNDALGTASPNRTPPRHAHLHQGDAQHGDVGPGIGVLYRHRAIRGIAGLLGRIWHGTHHERNPYARTNRVLDQWDDHTLAAAGCDRGDGDTHTNTYPATQPDAEATVPGQPAYPYAVLEGGADRNTGTARATQGDPHALTVLRGGGGELHRVAPVSGELTDG